MNKNDFELKTDQQLLDLYFQSGGNIDVNHYVTRKELIDALTTGIKMIGNADNNDGYIY